MKCNCDVFSLSVGLQSHLILKYETSKYWGLPICVYNYKTFSGWCLHVSRCLNVSKITPVNSHLKTEVSECLRLNGMKFRVL
jgi:hypothetical protein